MMSNRSTRSGLIFLRGFILGIISLSAFYYILLYTVTRDASHPLTQFSLFQPWMSLLVIGFGTQMGLFWMMRKGIQFNLQERKDSKMAAGTSTAVSGMAMVACCAHHAVDLIPILGLSAAAIFLSEYQDQLLIFGVLANLIGICMMLWFITGRPKPAIFFSSMIHEKKEAL